MINLKNWDLMRVVRLVAGSLIVWSAFVDKQPILGLLGGIFLLQAALNMGCGAGGCGIQAPRQTTTPEPAKDIFYEEIN